MGGPDACELILARMGEERGGDFLAKIVASQAVSPEMQDSAAFTLERHGDPRGVELLRVRVGHRNIPISHQFAVPAVIAGLNDPRAATVLRFIAANNFSAALCVCKGLRSWHARITPTFPICLPLLPGILSRS